jgi:16S rRNA (uracil1498-N3)-methyltransferase
MRSRKSAVITRPRFYAPGLDPSGNETTLSSEESHHLVRVMRLTAGDEVSVFDGRGHEFQARVVRADKSGAVVALGQALATPAEPAIAVVLVQAVLKGHKMDGVIRDATMAGVARVTPVVTERTLIGLTALDRAHAHERWQRIAISSAKQCRRAWLPEIEAPCTFQDWLGRPFDGLRVLLAEPSAERELVEPMRGVLTVPTRPTAVACVVGPEGGWSPAELDAAIASGCMLASLGSMTLRADAVGLVAVSIVNFALGSGT